MTDFPLSVIRAHFAAALPHSDDEIAHKAETLAKDFARLIQNQGPEVALNEAAILAGFDIEDKEEAAKLVSRLPVAKWWRRQLQVMSIRHCELEMLRAGNVGLRISPYISELSLRRMMRRRKRAQKAIEAATISSGGGQEIDLAQVIASSVSNPTIKRGEFFTRVKGVQAVAAEQNMLGFAIAITAPSKYHRMTVSRGFAVENDKWNGASPKETAQYLGGIFQKMRNYLSKKYLPALFGFRATEPHHDGTPHWHMIIFIAPEHVKKTLAIIRREAMREDRNEEGAKKRRVDIKPIDPKRGDAVAYAAAYISKNIDGKKSDGAAIEGGDWEAQTGAEEGAVRAVVWASMWGIRQFQLFGAEKIGQYRELRRFHRQKKAVEALIDHADTDGPARAILAGHAAPLALAACDARKAGRADVFAKLTGIREEAAQLIAVGKVNQAAFLAADVGDYAAFIRAVRQDKLEPVNLVRANCYGEEVKDLIGLKNTRTGAQVLTREVKEVVDPATGEFKQVRDSWSVNWGAKREALASDFALGLASGARSLGPVAITIPKLENEPVREITKCQVQAIESWMKQQAFLFKKELQQIKPHQWEHGPKWSESQDAKNRDKSGKPGIKNGLLKEKNRFEINRRLNHG
ncbi:replication endonuclease [Janthinobacterium sp. B9-8]|uniref:replication endonuclease n=1 Tax=Janthinobacterium sp. B9-8 TaxID=1236179 RepID=UPI00061CE0B3|nr:replication endonuclease [Janthinobacterium sp. B9-8]AMC34243.1 hypothetical protein VN23_06350 [Janthinobacterium sp. B9-8]